MGRCLVEKVVGWVHPSKEIFPSDVGWMHPPKTSGRIQPTCTAACSVSCARGGAGARGAGLGLWHRMRLLRPWRAAHGERQGLVEAGGEEGSGRHRGEGGAGDGTNREGDSSKKPRGGRWPGAARRVAPVPALSWSPAVALLRIWASSGTGGPPPARRPRATTEQRRGQGGARGGGSHGGRARAWASSGHGR